MGSVVKQLECAFKGRRVLITGHTGFKGSWLALWLCRLGADVVGYSLAPPTEPSNFVLSRIEELLTKHIHGDVRDAAQLSRTFETCEPEVVFHLAAQPLVRESYRTPAETFDTNVNGTGRILDAVRLSGKPCAVVVVTTDKCYENKEHVWGYRENDAMGGFDPYSASKAAAELLVGSYRKSFFPPEKEHGVQLASVRAGNVIGGGDWAADRIVTDIVAHLSRGTPVPVRNPSAVRPWQHVLEALSGYLMLAAKMVLDPHARWSAAWNFGPRPGDEVQVGSLVERFCEAWGTGGWKDVSDTGQPHEAATLRLCIDKAIWQLGWEPRWNVEEAVARTARWYRNVLSRDADARDECLKDIEDFERSPEKTPSR